MKVGDKVRFIGRETEKYHPDFAQLLGEVGVIVNVLGNVDGCYVVFEGFVDAVGDVEFLCWNEELEVID
jgi:rRNA processing protein Gar1